MTSPIAQSVTGLYPSGESVDVTLRDGSRVHIRPVRADDLDAVRAFLGGLSPESVILRFFGAADLDWASRWSVDVDYSDRYALIATVHPDGPIVAHGAYVREAPDRAEVAFVVADAYHELGIATVLLRRLAGLARVHGITTLTAFVLPYNHHMTDVFRDSGYPIRLRAETGQTRVEMGTSQRGVERAVA
jgi:GNAT superfamily N-acetyltransferase